MTPTDAHSLAEPSLYKTQTLTTPSMPMTCRKLHASALRVGWVLESVFVRTLLCPT